MNVEHTHIQMKRKKMVDYMRPINRQMISNKSKSSWQANNVIYRCGMKCEAKARKMHSDTSVESVCVYDESTSASALRNV